MIVMPGITLHGLHVKDIKKKKEFMTFSLFKKKNEQDMKILNKK